MNTRYKFTGKTTTAIVEYDGDDGVIVLVKFDDGENPSGARDWFLSLVPRFVEMIPAFADRFKEHLKVTEIPADLSFSRFWETYDYKVGKKQRVIELWQALTESDRIAALVAVPKYKQWLAQKPSMEMLYPQTFLTQRRWENNFRV